METFSSRLAQSIKQSGLSRPEFAARAGVGTSALAKWLSGKLTPKSEQLLSLAKTGDVSMEWLLTGKGPQSPSVRWWCNWMALLAYTEESMSAGVDGEKSNLNKKFLEQTESLIRKHIDGSPPEVSFSVSRESIQDFYDSFNLADHEGKAQMLGFNHDLSPKMLARFESVMKRNI